MTIEDLENYRDYKAQVSILEKQLLELENNLLPAGEKIGSRSTAPSDPTRNHAMKVVQLKDRLKAEKERLTDETLKVEKWVTKLEDPVIQNIVRCRYFLGYTWKLTSQTVFGKWADESTSRKTLSRFFEK